MTGNDSHRTPVDQALDLFVYLPVGFMVELSRSIPRFIERGRHELHAEEPTGSGMFDPAAQLNRMQAHAIGTLRALGVLAPQDLDADRRARPVTETEPDIATDQGPLSTEEGPVWTPSPPSVDVDPVVSEELAIPGYDSLSASQVMPRLEGLTGDELELVRRYEHRNRGRKTILNKIAQLQAG